MSVPRNRFAPIDVPYLSLPTILHSSSHKSTNNKHPTEPPTSVPLPRTYRTSVENQKWALARSARRIGPGNGRRGAMVALVLGPIALVIGGLVVATADGGLGTGNGIAGGIVAMMVGLIGMALGGLALAGSRRTA